MAVGRRRQANRLAENDIEAFSRDRIRRPLRPYQLEVARAVVDSVLGQRGLTIAVMIARQGGKNEVSAHVEGFLLDHFRQAGGQLVKAAPTFRPQLITSKRRLEQILAITAAGQWRGEWSYIVNLDKASCLFLSAQPGANVVGVTANHLLEFDEAQDIAIEKHDRDFSPMGATTNCTRVYWGTAWNDQTLLQQIIRDNEEAEQRDHLRRNFIYPWQYVAECLPAYAVYVEKERARLGPDHPLFTTQYELRAIGDTANLFGAAHLELLRGDHPRLMSPARTAKGDASGLFGEAEYIAAVDVAGEDEVAADAMLRALEPRRDSTVVLIGAVERAAIVPGLDEPRIRVVEAYWWTGRKHRAMYEELIETLRGVWGVRRVCVDASGVGAGLASFLEGALGKSVCRQVVFAPPQKSALGFSLLAAVNSGRLKWWAHEDSPEEREFWREAKSAIREMKANETMRWRVPERLGHDDFLIALALLVEAAGEASVPAAGAVIEPPPDYADGRY